MYRYGLIGNCQISALVNTSGSIDWLCLPRPDSDPVFGRLLDPEGGHFSIKLLSPDSDSPIQSRQYYVDNTNVLITELTNPNGDAIRITDFCPRFEQHGRMYRPSAIFRIVEPLSGAPFIKVETVPVHGWDKKPLTPVRGNSHLRFDLRDDNLRLITTMPLTYLCEETPFQLKEKTYFGLTWSFGIEEDLVHLSERFLAQTATYWRTWVKHCSIPSLFQKETIRSALALKLHCYEDTGAILAALTTSLPEEPGKERNWDYRYCWLRDAYFVLSAFHNLGHFEEMENFIKFLLGIAHQQEASRERLAPVYTLSQGLPLPETMQLHWSGYKNSAPVRCNNQAAEHVQNDVYGEMALTISPIFFDERFCHLRTREHEDLLSHLATLCSRTISKADAGLWEVRNGWQEHTFSNLMAWAGLERVERIQKRGYLKNLSFDAVAERARARAAVEKAIVEGSVRNGPSDQSFDASLALLPVLNFPGADVCRKTIEQICERLALKGDDDCFFYRYNRSDDFGVPHSAFLICSFWVAQGLARLGENKKAILLLEKVSRSANELGLYAEHFHPQASMQLGNFPQAYSHVGLINAAFEASPPWSSVL